jgi:hypothetical protein
MGDEQQPTASATNPPLAVRRPRHVEGDAVELDRNAARIETVLASLDTES